MQPWLCEGQAPAPWRRDRQLSADSVRQRQVHSLTLHQELSLYLKLGVSGLEAYVTHSIVLPAWPPFSL